MKEAVYAVSVLLTVSFCSFISVMGEHAKYVKLALGLILLAALATPIVSAISDFSMPELSYSESGEGGEVAEEVLKQAYEDGIRAALSDKFSLSSDEVAVSVSGFDRERLSAEAANVTLSGSAALADVRGIRGYVRENFCECEVFIDFEG